MFDVGDLVYHEKYGAGRILSPARLTSRVLFDMEDTELRKNRKADIENEKLSLLKETFPVNRLVYCPEYGTGIVKRYDLTSVGNLYVSAGSLYIGVKFFASNLKNDIIWCSPKYLSFPNKKSIDISPDVILRDIYNNTKEDIPGREKEFLSDVSKEDIKKLGIILRQLGDIWIGIIETP